MPVLTPEPKTTEIKDVENPSTPVNKRNNFCLYLYLSLYTLPYLYLEVFWIFITIT